MSEGPIDFAAAITAGTERRHELQRMRSRLGLGVSFGILAVWLLYVTAAGHWGRVGDQWASAVTMIFGSFVAGSTPQGGGAVAFPVFTKVLSIEPEVARSFSLCIQAIGMGAASLAIILNRRRVEWRAVTIAMPGAVIGFLLGLYLLGRRDDPFWPSQVPGAYVKVTFTLIVAGMAIVVYLGYRVHLLERLSSMPLSGFRVVVAIATAGLLGGLTSSLVGSGSDVIIYLAVVVLVGVSPRIGVSTSVIVMAGVSLLGLVILGVVDGQLSIALNDAGEVVGIGGRQVGESAAGVVEFGPGAPLPASRFDLFGLWLAAAPIVGFGAPIGSWVSAKVTDRQLVRFVVALAAAETLSTIIFLDGLSRNPDGALITYAVIGAIVVTCGLGLLKANRRTILGLPPVDLDQTFTRSRLDTGPRFREQLGSVGERNTREEERP